MTLGAAHDRVGGMRAAESDPIDEYVLALGARLRGPAPLRADLLAEARDGLVDAATAYRADGLPAVEARRLAVRDFGAVGEVAPAYQAELATTAAQRLALRLAVVLVVMVSASSLMWRDAPWADAPASATAYTVLSATVDRLGMALALGSLAAYAWLAWSARRGRPPSARAAHRIAGAALVGVVALTAGGLGMYAYTVSQAHAALTWPPMVIGGVLTGAALTWLAGGAARCLRWTGRAPA
jgi:hypothetical protein